MVENRFQGHLIEVVEEVVRVPRGRAQPPRAVPPLAIPECGLTWLMFIPISRRFGSQKYEENYFGV